jgi:hypothetical protein
MANAIPHPNLPYFIGNFFFLQYWGFELKTSLLSQAGAVPLEPQFQLYHTLFNQPSSW